MRASARIPSEARFVARAIEERELLRLAEHSQRGLRLRESLVWFTLAALCGGQIALIYWLLD